LLFFTSWRITVQLKFNVFYGPTSMKKRCGAPLLGLAKSIYIYHYYESNKSTKRLTVIFLSIYGLLGLH